MSRIPHIKKKENKIESQRQYYKNNTKIPHYNTSNNNNNNKNNNNMPNQQDDVSSQVQIALYTIVGTISLLCNSVIFMVIGTNKKMKTKSNLMLLSLATTDWLTIIIGIPIHLINLAKGGNQTRNFLCDISGFLILIPFLASNFNLTLIAVHRYVLVVRNTDYRWMFTQRNTYLLIAAVWAIGITLSAPPLLGWGSFAYDNNRAHCMVDWQRSLTYLVFLQLLAYPAPMCIMCFCYYKIMKHSYASTKRLAVTAAVVSSEHRRIVAKKKREVRLSIMLLLVVLCFFILYFPYAILIVHEGIAGGKPSHAFSFIAMLSAYSNSMVDFWIYAAMSTKFRQALKCFLSRMICRVETDTVHSHSAVMNSLSDQGSKTKD